MREIYKDISGYEGVYQISNKGNVKSLSFNRSGKNRILKFGVNDGYFVVMLYKNKLRKNCSVHRLVANEFIPNPDGKEQINHIDGNKVNNCVENLEWSTISENQIHRFKVLNHKGPNFGKLGKDNNNSVKVEQYSKQGDFIRCWDSIMDVHRELGINSANISNCCRGRLKSVGGYKWKYVTNF